jgi:hypothetical protein
MSMLKPILKRGRGGRVRPAAIVPAAAAILAGLTVLTAATPPPWSTR